MAVAWLKRLFGGSDDPAAVRWQGDPTVLDRDDDPRGGTQSGDYRYADPRRALDRLSD